MEGTVKIIVTGDRQQLIVLREQLAQLLQKNHFDVVEKGQPKEGNNPKFQVMYLQGKPVLPPRQRLDPEYTVLEEGA